MIEIVEVSPRDGLQNESSFVSTEDKVELISRAVDAGFNRIEATSFVHPKAVPQLADAEEVIASLPRSPQVSYSALVLNRRGVDRAISAGVDELNAVVVASEVFSQRNQGMTTAESLDFVRELLGMADRNAVRVSVTIATAFGCPFIGEVGQGRVVDIAAHLADVGVTEISLADTIGVGVPKQVGELFAKVAGVAPDALLRAHFHNTRNTGYANAVAAINAGVSVLDASIGGIGGCPFAPRATGNIASEDLLYLLGRSDIDVRGVDVDKVIRTAKWLGGILGRETPGLLPRSGLFPPDPVAGGVVGEEFRDVASVR